MTKGITITPNSLLEIITGTYKAKLTDIPRNLATTQRRIIQRIDTLSERLESGEITLDEWYRQMGEVIAKGAGGAFRAGKGGGSITDEETRIINRFINEQLVFLDNFRDDIRDAGEFLPKFFSRAQMYGTATTSMYAMGDVVKQAGRPLALPSMPAEGTICHTNCGCRWEIVTINKDNKDYDCFWRLGKDDNCQTCVQRAQDWAPVRIRGGSVLS